MESGAGSPHSKLAGAVENVCIYLAESGLIMGSAAFRLRKIWSALKGGEDVP